MGRFQTKSRQMTADAHLEALRKVLARRMEAARSKGDERLIRMLEAEAQYLR